MYWRKEDILGEDLFIEKPVQEEMVAEVEEPTFA